MDKFSDFDLSDNEQPQFNPRRLDVEWTTLNAIREMLGIALKGVSTPTYEQALALGRILSPELFDSAASLIGKGNEQQIVREYRQKAEARSEKEKRIVSPVEVVDKDIEDHNDLLDTSGDRSLIRKRLNFLQHVRILLLPQKHTENQLIIRDLFKADRDIPVPPIEGDTYREYRLTEDRGLRIRLLHPDPPEHSIGADLIYEHYWDKKRIARLALIQYKIWNGQTLYSSQSSNLENQLSKLKSIFCDTGLCTPFERSARLEAYRLPFCVAFLRPTDKLQQPDSHLKSSGLHVPICVVQGAWKDTGRGGKKIESKDIRSESLSHKVFEEVFNTNMLGSRWLTYDEVEELYRKHKILQPNERIVLHAQEFGLS